MKKVCNVKGHEVVNVLRSLISKGNATHILVKDTQGKVMVDLPASLIVLGVFLAPFLSGICAALGFMKSYSIEIK